MNLRLTVLVPVYNEEKTLPTILGKIQTAFKDDWELIIVNDASKDRSPEIIREFAHSKAIKHLQVVDHPKNKGKGAGIQTALKLARGRFFIIQDADLEYDPKDIAKLINFAETNGAQAVYGSRFKGRIKNMARANYYANKFYNFLLRRLYGTKITDMHTCYKLVETALLRDLKMKSDGFGYAPELVSKLLLRGVEINELPISFNGRTRRDGKKIGVADGVECIASLLKYRFGAKAK